MTELRSGVMTTPHNEGMTFEQGQDILFVKEGKTEFYLKSEADKVIAEKDKVIAELKSENRFIKERLDQQEKSFKWHRVEMLFGKLTGDLPSRDLNRIYGRDFLVHYTVIIGGRISDGIAYSDYDDDEGFFELENGCTPVHWCEVPLPPLADKLKEGV